MAEGKFHTLDIHSVVIDAGAGLTKIGYAGDEAPRYVAPSVFGLKNKFQEPSSMDSSEYINSELYLHSRRPNLDIISPYDGFGLFSDWKGIEQHWHYIFNYLGIIPEESPILICEPAHNTRDHREKLTTMLFESFNVPAVYFAKNPVLSTFANGRTSGLVFDFGASHTSVSPVLEGTLINKANVFSILGGNAVTQLLDVGLTLQGVNLRPRYRLSQRDGEEVIDLGLTGIRPSFDNFHRFLLVNDIKHALCSVSEYPIDPTQGVPSTPHEAYYLPDGQQVHVSSLSTALPELYFNTRIGTYLKEVIGDALTIDVSKSYSVMEQAKTVFGALDGDTRREVFSNFIVSGGGSLLTGLKDRLIKEVESVFNIGNRVLSLDDSDRKWTNWIGGSILSNLSAFHQLWVSKQEFSEHGISVVERKCK
ncbi:hypothetical protein RCL1_009173 [Eukaryota sp. TZLM3-RCL]